MSTVEFKDCKSRFSAVVRNTEKINIEERGVTKAVLCIHRSVMRGTEFAEYVGKIVKAIDIDIVHYNSIKVKVNEVEFYRGYAYLVIGIASLVYGDVWGESLLYLQVRLEDSYIVEDIFVDFKENFYYELVKGDNDEKYWVKVTYTDCEYTEYDEDVTDPEVEI